MKIIMIDSDPSSNTSKLQKAKSKQHTNEIKMEFTLKMGKLKPEMLYQPNNSNVAKQMLRQVTSRCIHMGKNWDSNEAGRVSKWESNKAAARKRAKAIWTSVNVGSKIDVHWCSQPCPLYCFCQTQNITSSNQLLFFCWKATQKSLKGQENKLKRIPKGEKIKQKAEPAGAKTWNTFTGERA